MTKVLARKEMKLMEIATQSRYVIAVARVVIGLERVKDRVAQVSVSLLFALKDFLHGICLRQQISKLFV